MRALIALLALTATATAYPFVVPRKKGAEAEFRKRNPQHWATVETDKEGFVIHVATDDPELIGTLDDARLAKVRAFVKANADLFGVPVEAADRITGTLLVDEVDSALMGEIQFGVDPTRFDLTSMFWVAAPEPKVDQGVVVTRIAGQKYRETIGYAEPARIDCGMTPLGRKGCESPVKHTRVRGVTMATENVEVFTALLRQGNTIRLVACGDVRSFEDPPADPAWGDAAPLKRSFAPIGGAPALPLVIDRVTGEVLHPRITGCYDPALMDPRRRD